MPKNSPTKIAFIADIHFHDIYAELSDSDFIGLPTETHQGKKNALIRSMSSQLNSTRLFNENYFVLLATLDNLVARDIKLVALPGDFSDDGQPMHIRGLVEILNTYQRQHGMRFFAIPGNHDPVRPFTIPGGKADFLAKNGKEIGLYSEKTEQCNKQSTANRQPGSNTIAENNIKTNVVCTEDIKKWGYKEIVTAMSRFGFFPTPDDIYYETPFGDRHSASFEQRQFVWCNQNLRSHKTDSYKTDSHKTDAHSDNTTGHCINMPDTSYLVEPIDGLWLLAIDANVYTPKQPEKLSYDGSQFNGSSNAGYNAMLTYKPEIIDWITSVVQRAKQHNKQLIAFSHFPMADFYDQAGEDIQRLFGNGAHQMRRMPLKNTAKVLANTGLKVHVGGHMHINDTGTVHGDNGQVLFNIQAPTLAAYRPGYKILTLNLDNKPQNLSSNLIEVETVVLDNIPRFNELFPHYWKELNYLRQSHPTKAWNEEILHVDSYGEFTDAHLKGLIRSRYLPKEWPKSLIRLLSQGSMGALLTHTPCRNREVDFLKKRQNSSFEKIIESVSELPAYELINDFYRLRNADSIALVSEERKTYYLFMAEQLSHQCESNESAQLAQLLAIMAKFIQAQPSNHLYLHLDTGEIQGN
ncbi:metallophosphoesterase family protein [Marinibactrum halimedae]|uniref:Metallophosphoesterase n=1 Tax=Marinibactrum halimedae TaxID=1444977 RepID=A0AA37T3M7_9GAMM|nr:metallophosphoesterase [Marinibactrum halimedae]MCD9460131.1 metallophosphoesterase [Marinibactrum halimedae]GLS26399.1 metallophosphoesterase [Marinibactrum halimedae]